MWVVIVILLCASGSRAKNICENDSPYRKCSAKSLPRDYPENAAEYKESLRSILKFYECLKNYEDSCMEKLFQEGEYDSIRSVLTDISTEGTHLNSIVTANFDCLLEAIKNREIDVKSTEDIRKALRKFHNVSIFDQAITEKGDSEEKEKKIAIFKIGACLENFVDFGTLVNTITTECGEELEETAIDVIHRGYFLQRYCSAEDVLESQNILEELNLDETIKAAVRDSIQLLGKWD